MGDIFRLLPTAAPQPETPATPSPDEGLTLPFRDDFSDPTSGWYTLRDETGISDYENGAFHMRVDKANWLVYSGVPLPATDVVIEVDAEKAGGVEVYALFPYMNMADGQLWAREWLREGEVLVRKDVEWDEGRGRERSVRPK